MGTAVLSPQDCFVSPHGRHNHRFKDMMHPCIPNTPKLRRNALQAAVMQSGIPSSANGHARPKSCSAACNLAEIDVINRFNDSPGLLPVPASGLEPRHSSLTRPSVTSASNLKHVSSTVSSRPRQPASSLAVASPCPRRASSTATNCSSKSKSRSVSAGLLASRGSQTRTVGELGYERLIPSNDGCLSKVVQNSLMVGRAAEKFETGAGLARRRDVQSSKFSAVERKFHESRIVGCESVSDLRKRTHADFAGQQGFLEKEGFALPRNGSLEVGATNGSRRDFEGKKIGKRRETDMEFLEIGAREKDAGRPPVITILQRPKDKDAAVELIARFFKEVEAGSVKECSDGKSHLKVNGRDSQARFKAKGYCVPNECTKMNILKTPRLECSNGFPDVENSPLVSERLAVCKDLRTPQKGDFSSGATFVRQGSMDSQIVSRNQYAEMIDVSMMDVSPCGTDTEDVGVGEISKYIVSIFGDDKWLPMFCDERWAGPAFTNSPPPSSLPLPKFPMKQFRTTSSQSSYVGKEAVAGSLHHPPPGTPFVSFLPSTKRSVSFNGRSPINEQEGACDVAFATKDLRRLLNLDAC